MSVLSDGEISKIVAELCASILDTKGHMTLPKASIFFITGTKTFWNQLDATNNDETWPANLNQIDLEKNLLPQASS